MVNGNFSKTNTVKITRLNIFDRVATFRRVMAIRGDTSCPPGPNELKFIILKMLHSGKFSPTSDWVLGRFGMGMDDVRSETMLKMVTEPASCNLADVNLIFFEGEKRRPRVSSAQLMDLIVDNHVPECALNGGPCCNQHSFQEFMDHFSRRPQASTSGAHSDSD